MTLYYTKEHEWIQVIDLDTKHARIGISDFAQDQLGDIVYVELKDVGDEIAMNDEIAVVESVKSASEVYAPVSLVITKVNDALVDDAGLINSSAESDGWLYEATLNNVDDLSTLMDASSYEDYIK